MTRKRTDAEKGKCDGRMFGKRVRALRIAKELSILSFSEQVGICRNYVSQIEAGDKLPSFEVLVLIARVLDTTPNDLMMDYVKTDKEIGIQSSQIESHLQGLTAEERDHIQEMILSEVNFLIKQRGNHDI